MTDLKANSTGPPTVADIQGETEPGVDNENPSSDPPTTTTRITAEEVVAASIEFEASWHASNFPPDQPSPDGMTRRVSSGSGSRFGGRASLYPSLQDIEQDTSSNHQPEVVACHLQSSDNAFASAASSWNMDKDETSPAVLPDESLPHYFERTRAHWQTAAQHGFATRQYLSPTPVDVHREAQRLAQVCFAQRISTSSTTPPPSLAHEDSFEYYGRTHAYWVQQADRVLAQNQIDASTVAIHRKAMYLARTFLEKSEEKKEEVHAPFPNTTFPSAPNVEQVQEATVLLESGNDDGIDEGSKYGIPAVVVPRAAACIPRGSRPVREDNVDDLVALKREAYLGNVKKADVDDDDDENDASFDPPLRMIGESADSYYARTYPFWNTQAVAALRSNGWEPLPNHVRKEARRMVAAFLHHAEYVQDIAAEVLQVERVNSYEDAPHPMEWSEASTAAAQAEWVGTDYRNHKENNPESVSVFPTEALSAYCEDDATEATVIDSAPLEELNADDDSVASWKCNADHVQVLPDNVDNAGVQYSEEALDPEAEVLGVEEDLHPSEYENANDAQAEFVGTTAEAYATPVQTETPRDQQQVDSRMASGEAVVMEDSQPTGPDALYNPIKSGARAVPIQRESSGAVALSAQIASDDTDSCEDTVGDMMPPPLPPPSLNVRPDDSAQDSTKTTSSGTPVARRPIAQEKSSGSISNTSDRSNQSATSRPSHLGSISREIVRGTSNVIEALFGDTKPSIRRVNNRPCDDATAEFVRTRKLLPWSVIYSTTNNMWVATLQTNQRALESNNVEEASKSLRAFSLPTEKQALSLARAWTPPKMLPFSNTQHCHMCQSKFAVFRRACHCRNCGVCVCHDCTVQWPLKMLPETYNIKRESSFNICKACDWLCTSFRLALLEGNRDKAVALHATGNVNLTTPFANIKGELLYPVHCAVMGGNMELLRWLVDEHCCPIKSVRVSGKNNDSKGRYTPIVTSKGRSLLGMAMQSRHVQIVRYLVVEKGISLASEKDITPAMLLLNLDAVLRLLPDTVANAPALGATTAIDDVPPDLGSSDPSMADENGFGDGQHNPRTLSQEARDFGAVYRQRGSFVGGNGPLVEDDDGNTSNGSSVYDECIICFDGKIDCVATPCGHQICCLRCSENIDRCPVCAAECTFLRVYKP